MQALHSERRTDGIDRMEWNIKEEEEVNQYRSDQKRPIILELRFPVGL